MAQSGTSSAPVYSNITISTTSVGSYRVIPSTIYTGTGNPFAVATAPPTAIQINSQTTSEPILKIHQDGRIEYSGKPSEAADAFYKSLCGSIDIKAAGELALEKTYRRAIKRCLNQAKSMSHEDFIAMLETELETRNSKAVLMRLTEDE